MQFAIKALFSINHEDELVSIGMDIQDAKNESQIEVMEDEVASIGMDIHDA